SGDALLRHVDERIVRFTFGSPPTALVHDVCITRCDEILGGKGAAVQHELLELTVSGVEQGTTGCFVHAAGLHADHAVFDEIDATHAEAPTDRIQRVDEIDRAELFPIHGYGRATHEPDDDVLRRIGRVLRIGA